MRKTAGILFIGLLMVLVNACSSGQPKEELIIGTWNTDQFLVDGEESDRKDALQGFVFSEDGSVVALGEEGQEQDMGTFEFKGDTLVMAEGNAKAYIQKLTATKMVMIPIDDEVMEVHLSKQE